MHLGLSLGKSGVYLGFLDACSTLVSEAYHYSQAEQDYFSTNHFLRRRKPQKGVCSSYPNFANRKQAKHFKQSLYKIT